MNETRIYADAFETTFANTKEMLEFLAERAKASQWIRKPTRMLRLVPLEKEAETIEKACTKQLEGIVEDTEKNTQLVLKINGEVYPVRDCAMHTILKRAGVSGTGLRKLEKATYAKVINYCLKVARGDALIKIADGKVSAVHGGDEHDYCVLDMEAVFSMTCDYLKAHFSGSAYLEGSGTYDHSIASAMWTLEGNQELLDTYRQALKDHDLEDKALAPALRLTTSDVAASGANLYIEYQDFSTDIESAYLDKENVKRLHILLHNLKEPYKEVFTLRVFGELPFSQIAELFGKTDSWARLIFYRAKKQLQEDLR